MRFSITTLLALAASAFAQTPDFDPITAPTYNQVVPAGSTLKITWQAPAKYAAGTISITLIGGATQNTQVPLAVIASGVKNSALSYDWLVDAALGELAVYGLIFKYESSPDIFQYSNPFHIKAGTNPPAGTTTSTVTTSTGVKTVTLSTQSVESTTSSEAVPTSTSSSSSSVSVPTYTIPSYNTSTTLATYTSTQGPQTTVVAPSNVLTSTTWASPTNGTVKPTIVPTIAPGSAGTHVGASSVALIGGLIVAFLAL